MAQFDARIGLQHTLFDKFNGTRSTVDGMGCNAGDNNTLLLCAWVMF